jgi:hypothetical protein
MPSLRERFATRFFGDIIERAVAAAVSIRIDDSRGWDQIAGSATPVDTPWSERRDDLDDALEAWRKNFLVRRIVTLVTSYVVGNGITISSQIPEVNEFIQEFWNHPENRMDRRLRPMCNELTRAGELFPTLFTNRIDGMSYVRFIPASRIIEIDTDADDYEKELRYKQLTNDAAGKWWFGPAHKRAFKRIRGPKLHPLMLHFTVNKPIGATRGESDLTPVLPWAKRYTGWLQDRVRLNRQRTRQGVLDIEIADDSLVEEKRRQLRRTNPIEAGIYVHGKGEVTQMHNLNLQADEAKEDGRALRLAVAAGANIGLHYLGEGESINYATAKEMGEPTARFYSDRQKDYSALLCDLVTAAYYRKLAQLTPDAPHPPDLQLTANTTEVARADNESLAKAAREIVQALAQMRTAGWVDDLTAATLAFKFAGEPLGEEEIEDILANATPTSPNGGTE